MIDLRRESALNVGKACRVIAEYTGKTPSPQTVVRYIHRGILAGDGTRVQLAATKVGRELLTTDESIERFFDELSRRSRPSTPQPQMRNAEVEASLKAEGLIA